jgi:hypothetical protein
MKWLLTSSPVRRPQGGVEEELGLRQRAQRVGNASRGTFVITSGECHHGDQRNFPDSGLISSMNPWYGQVASL